MKDLMLPCSCGGKSILGRTDLLIEMVVVSSTCSVCGKRYVDNFEIKHIGRYYEAMKQNPKLRRIQ